MTPLPPAPRAGDGDARGASAFLHNLVVFGRLLRRAGLDVHTGRLIDVTQALSHLDLSQRDEVYHACRALLTHRREDLATFDRLFTAFWRQQALAPPPPAHQSERAEYRQVQQRSGSAVETSGDDDDDDDDDADEEENDGEEREQQTWSDAASLAQKDLAEFTTDEMQIAQVALERLTWTPGWRRTRRWVAGRGPRIDVRRAIARSVRTGGDIVVLPRQRRRQRPRSLVLLCDVSGSMERYSRMLLHFAYALTRRQTRVEVFLFATRLTRITPDLRTRAIDEAVSRVSQSVQDWSGGTRIGDCLKQLNQRWSRRVLVRDPVVLLVSDGWDRGDPAVIRAEVARLQRSCHRLIWLNPLLGTIDYAPLTRGLQAALPFVDDFLPARTLSNVADLAVH
jgi:uncharacterized protein with von Willebrand factor type A (vWA) domain